MVTARRHIASQVAAAGIDTQLRELSQHWRRCLASLLLFTIILTNNFGLSSSRRDAARPQLWRAAFHTAASAPRSLQQCLPTATSGVCQTEPPYNASSLPLRREPRELQSDCSVLQQHMRHRHLTHCYRVNLWDSLNATARKRSSCLANRLHIDYIERLDRQIGMEYANFESIINRLDCQDKDRYSVIYDCDECKVSRSPLSSVQGCFINGQVSKTDTYSF